MVKINRVELLQNSNFYKFNADDAENPEHFQDYTSSGSVTVDWFKDADYQETDIDIFSQDGGGLSKLNDMSSFTGGIRTIFNIPVTASKSYNVLSLIKTYLTAGYIGVKVYWYQSDNSTAASTASDSGTTFYGYGDWKKSVLQVTSPANAAYARVCVEAVGATGIAWIDNLSFSRQYIQYITSAQFTDYTRLSVGTSSSDILTDNFNENVIPASLRVEKDTGQRWEYLQDPDYEIIQRLTAFMTAHLCSVGHRGTDVPDDLLETDNKTMWLTEYKSELKEFFKPETMIADTTKGEEMTLNE